MDTLQAIASAILHGMTSVLPVSESAHHWLIANLFGWPRPGDELQGALSGSVLLAILVYYRHDWASILSSGLRALFSGRLPMMLDERMPFFLVLSFIPALLAWTYSGELRLDELFNSNWIIALVAATTLPLWFSETMNRRTKSMSYWNWKDSLILGAAQCSFLIPGVGRQAGALVTASLLNYQREGAIKFSLLSFAPVLALQTIAGLKTLSFKAASPHGDLTWMSFWVASVVGFFTALLTINYLVKHTQTKGYNGVIVYRWILTAAMGAVYWFKLRNA